MPRSINAEVNVILTFDGKEQMFYDAPLVITLPIEDKDAFEVEMVRQILLPVPNDGLQDLVKISTCYSGEASEGGKPLALFDDAEANQAIDHMTRHNGKYYFQPDQRDDYEQRLVDELGIASRTRDFA